LFDTDHTLNYKKAIIASIEASKIIMDFYDKGFKSNIKSDGSPVTEADLAASKIISEILLDTDIPILGEETEHQSFTVRKNWILNWCVDPLDGTKEYIKRNGEFAVNIALIEKNQPIFGVIAWPAEKKVLFGGKTIGVYITEFDNLNNKDTWVKLSAKDSVNNPLVMTISHSVHSGASKEYIDELKNDFPNIDFIKKGSALKFFDLAQGIADIYPRFAPTMEWDIAAGQAILEALGGTICDLETGNSLRYNKENLLNPYFIARTNPLVKHIE